MCCWAAPPPQITTTKLSPEAPFNHNHKQSHTKTITIPQKPPATTWQEHASKLLACSFALCRFKTTFLDRGLPKIHINVVPPKRWSWESGHDVHDGLGGLLCRAQQEPPFWEEARRTEIPEMKRSGPPKSWSLVAMTLALCRGHQ